MGEPQDAPGRFRDTSEVVAEALAYHVAAYVPDGPEALVFTRRVAGRSVTGASCGARGVRASAPPDYRAT